MAMPVFTTPSICAAILPPRMVSDIGTVASETKTPPCRLLKIANPDGAMLPDEGSRRPYPERTVALSPESVCESPPAEGSWNLIWLTRELGIGVGADVGVVPGIGVGAGAPNGKVPCLMSEF